MVKQRSSVVGIVLASGYSKRFGESDKLLATIDGISVVRRTLGAYISALESIWVVVRPSAHSVIEHIRDLPVNFVINTESEQGMSTSIRAGLSAIPSCDAAVIGVADQPLLNRRIIEALVVRYEECRQSVVIPRYAGNRGNPVLFASKVFPSLLTLRGDIGGRAVFSQFPCEFVDIDDWRIGIDVDSAQDLGTAREISAASPPGESYGPLEESGQ